MSKYFFNFLIGIFFVFLLYLHGLRNNLIIEFGFLSVGIFSLYMMNKHKNQPYSLFKMFFIFVFFFYCVAPWLQYKNDLTIWSNIIDINDSTYIKVSIYTFIFIIAYYLSYKNHKVRFKQSKNYIQFNYNWNYPLKFIFLIISVSVLLLILYLNNFSVYSMLLRGGELTSRVSLISSLNLIINNFVRPIPIIIFIFYSLSNIPNFFWKFIFLLIALFTTFPAGLPRFNAAALYIPILLIYFPFLRKNNNFIVTIFISLLFVFPFLSSFRYYSLDKELSFGFNINMFLGGDFDAYNNFLLSVQYDFITYGQQILGVLLFFVPRNIWPSKPIGSGHQLSENINLDFNNISMTLPSEGYVNFGVLGVILFAVIIGVITKKMDYKYWYNDNNNISFKVPYLFMLGMLFFMLRGDLLSSFAFTTGLLFSSFFVYFLIKTIKKIR